MERREFLRLMGIMSGTAAASWETGLGADTLLSNLMPPDKGVVPGEPVFYRTTCTECPANCGLMATVRAGHPVKLEGIPDHPVNHGALCLRGQVALARLYHGERLRQPMVRDASGQFRPVSWGTAIGQVQNALQESRKSKAGNVFLSGRTTGSLSRLIDEFCQVVPAERLPELELYHQGALRQAYGWLFGRRSVPAFRIDRADLLVTFGADLLETFISPVNFAWQFAQTRGGETTWYHLEPHLSLTGARADHRLAIRPGGEAHLLAYLLAHLQLKNPLPPDVRSALPRVSAEEAAAQSGLAIETIRALQQDIQRAKRPLLMAGGVATAQPNGLAVAMLAGLLQWGLGAVGKTVDFTGAVPSGRVGNLNEVRSGLNRIGGKAAGVCFLSRLHSLAAVPEAADVLSRSLCWVGLTDFLYPDLQRCEVLLPVSHSLESWGDAEPRLGLKNQIRPVFRPLFDTQAEGDILLRFMPVKTSYKQYLFERWKGFGKGWWDRGFTEYDVPAEELPLRAGDAAAGLRANPIQPAVPAPALVLVPSLRTYDGRSRVIGLLHEIPDTLAAVSYGEWIGIAPEDARRLSLSDQDEVQLGCAGGQATLAVRTQPGLPTGIMMLPVDQLQGIHPPVDPGSGEQIAVVSGATLARTGRNPLLGILSGSMEARNRGIVPEGEHAHHHPEQRTLYPEHPHRDYRWAMAIDLDRCTGCAACVGACYIENNIPLTGPDEHRRGREMSWLRIEPFLGDGNRFTLLPMLCQQCDHAPCENVCPVYATYHNPEGLNVQVYNRCVGTRYCSNNCPYKVRRFNWLDHERSGAERLLVNPDVSPRSKGIMEKCTFCIHRIRRARDQAKDEHRLIKDGEATPACAQTCPVQAITFGNLLDPESRVSKLASSPRAYRVLEELGTRPAVYYLSSRENER